MAQLDLTVGACRVRMTYVGALSPNHLTSLVASGHGMSTAVALDWASFNVAASNVYDYRIRLQDGRLWRQTIAFNGGVDSNPIMTFNVSQGWSLSEFTAQRDWRAECISLRNSIGATLIRLDHV